MTTLVVMAKVPVPGRVKTRLCPPCDPPQAAEVARAALEDTLAVVGRARSDRLVVALDGAAPSWLDARFEVIPQGSGSLDQRLASVFDQVSGPAFLVGMDTPQLRTAHLDAAVEALATGVAVLGPAVDGGWWGLGLVEPTGAALSGVPMSEDRTGAYQEARLRQLGLDVVRLDELRDVDTWDDACTVASLAPTTRFAAAVRRVGAAHAPRQDAP